MINMFVTIGKGSTRDTFMPPHIIKRLESIGNARYNNFEQRLSEEMLGDNLENTEICVTGWGCPYFSGSVLDKAAKLKLIAHVGGSVAKIRAAPTCHAYLRIFKIVPKHFFA